MAEAKHIIIIGSTGLLGQALMTNARANGFNVTGIARKNADINLDATNKDALLSAIKPLKPNIIINAAAIVSLADCEENPEYAMEVNAGISSTLSIYCNAQKIKYVFISTDHYYTGDSNNKHDEKYALNLCNQYALSKQRGEQHALENNQALIVRTNIVGFRHRDDQHTFVEWAIDSLLKKSSINLFTDFYTSSIDVTNFAELLLDLIETKSVGIYNLACSDVVNKSVFVIALAHKIGLSIDKTKNCKMLEIPSAIDRNESLGLDVSKVEKTLNRSMPNFDEVINSLATEYLKDRE